MKIVRTESNAHWYDKEGKPFHTIIGKNGKERNTTVKDARALDLLPSVTSVISILAKPQLEAWKQEQAILCSLTLPRIEGESELDFARRIAEDAREQGLKAMGLGSRVHKVVEDWVKLENKNTEILPAHEDVEAQSFAMPIITWLNFNVDWTKPVKSELRLASAELGFAGTTDLLCHLTDGRKALIDYKTQNTKADYDHKCKAYPEMSYQLAAYGLIEPCDVYINLLCSTASAGSYLAHEWKPEEINNAQVIFDLCLKLFKVIKGV